MSRVETTERDQFSRPFGQRPHHDLSLFVFRRRDEGYTVTQAGPSPTLQLARLLRVRAAEKQKERIRKAFGAYKQATPNGVGLRASSVIRWG